MIEENNDILRKQGDALVYRTNAHKYSTTFVWTHPFSTYLSYDRLFQAILPLYAYVRI